MLHLSKYANIFLLLSGITERELITAVTQKIKFRNVAHCSHAVGNYNHVDGKRLYL
jgi:hypothetical protein